MKKMQKVRLNLATRFLVGMVRSSKLYMEEELMKLPKLVAVDLRRIDEFGSGRIKTGSKNFYIAKIGSGYYFGWFSRQWYGLNFEDGWGASGHQFDPPGTNSSKWKKLWKFVYLKPKT